MQELEQIVKNLTNDQKRVLAAILPFLKENGYIAQLAQSPNQLVTVLDNVDTLSKQNVLGGQQMNSILHGIVKSTIAHGNAVEEDQKTYDTRFGDGFGKENDALEGGLRNNSAVTNQFVKRTDAVKSDNDEVEDNQSANVKSPFAIPTPGKLPEPRP